MDSQKITSRHAAEARRSGVLMRRLLLGFKARLDHELKPKNVTTAQLRFLHEVKEHPGGSGAQMARACYVTPQSAQAMMVRAVARGWVVRGRDSANERVVTARLTPAGERLLRHADAVLGTVEAEVWSAVGTAELKTLNEVLQRGLERLDSES